MLKKNWRFIKYGLFVSLMIIMAVSLSNVVMVKSTQHKQFNAVNDIPYNDVALVLGASFKTVKGNINPFFYARMKAASALYHGGKVKHILVSGDNSSVDYDESTDMKNYLISLGIDEKDITLDFAGFRTFDSVVRCKSIFGVEKVTIVSQAFHTPRALFLAKKSGLDAIAFNAEHVQYSNKVQLREKFARVKAVLDIYILNKKPKFLGKKEPIILSEDQ